MRLFSNLAMIFTGFLLALAGTAVAEHATINYIGQQTKPLVDDVFKATDPNGNFAAVAAVRFPITLGGLFFEMHENQEAFFRPDIMVTVSTKKRQVVFENFPAERSIVPLSFGQ